jgi:hypothetical protein
MMFSVMQRQSFGTHHRLKRSQIVGQMGKHMIHVVALLGR